MRTRARIRTFYPANLDGRPHSGPCSRTWTACEQWPLLILLRAHQRGRPLLTGMIYLTVSTWQHCPPLDTEYRTRSRRAAGPTLCLFQPWLKIAQPEKQA